MYSETDRTWIRHFGGWGAIYQQADPRLEAAISATQSVADGGTRPDSNGENLIKALIYGQAAVVGTAGVTVSGTAQNTAFASPAQRGLIQIEANIAMQDTFLGTSSADGGEVKINPAREMIRLRSEGRRLVNAMCIVLGLRGPRVDMFGTGKPTGSTAWPFFSDESEVW
jgi:hypothetical protein